jgi:hypothetical protein
MSAFMVINTLMAFILPGLQGLKSSSTLRTSQGPGSKTQAERLAEHNPWLW